MEDCLFCKIGKKEIPSKLVYEDADIFAFEDIQPQAPNHILICPRKHLISLTEATEEDAAMLGKLQLVAAKLAGERSLSGEIRCLGAFGERRERQARSECTQEREDVSSSHVEIPVY